jgi:hypothetical protein
MYVWRGIISGRKTTRRRGLFVCGGVTTDTVNIIWESLKSKKKNTIKDLENFQLLRLDRIITELKT